MLIYIIKHMNQHQDKHSNGSAHKQEIVPAQEATSAPLDVNRLAPAERKRFFRGLERFVNTGDSAEEYKALAKGWRGFWPRELLDRQGHSLAWHDDCHALFLVFRNALRYGWTPLPDAVKRRAVSFLLGIGGESETLEAGGTLLLPVRGLNEAWDKIRKHNPSGSDTSRPLLYPRWTTGEIAYVPGNDFQCALYLLFRESWRAKVCAKCSTYFVASKPAQLYCSTACSGGVKRERTLKWWRSVGVKRRATRAKENRKGDAASRGGRQER
jgi:hypothetical protein